MGGELLAGAVAKAVGGGEGDDEDTTTGTFCDDTTTTKGSSFEMESKLWNEMSGIKMPIIAEEVSYPQSPYPHLMGGALLRDLARRKDYWRDESWGKRRIFLVKRNLFPNYYFSWKSDFFLQRSKVRLGGENDDDHMDHRP